MKHRDYYSVLGVPKEASKEDIQRAYRKGARKYHPDVNKDKDAETRFKEISEANDVLKDPEKRKRYDIYGENWDQPSDSRSNGEENWQQYGFGEDFSSSFRAGSGDYGSDAENVKDFFSNLFGGNLRNGSVGSGRGNGYQHGPQIFEAEISLNLAELLNTGTKSISFITQEVNPNTGQLERKEKKLKVNIPKGVSDGSVIRIRNFDKSSTPDENGADLLLKIHISGDSRFKIEGQDLYTTVSISPWEAALGAKVTVQTVEGRVNLAIPPGTRAGKRFRLKGKGLPGRKADGGDIIVETLIQIPDSLSDDEKQLFQELSKKSEYNPRSEDGQRAGQSEKV